MNRLIVGIILLLVIIGIQACVEDKVIVKDDVFFSLDKFMAGEKEELSEYKRIRKVVALNGKRDSSDVELEQARKELDIFANADINKASWLDKYKVDSIFSDAGSLKQLAYTSLDSSLNTRKLLIDYTMGDVSHIKIKRKKETLISSKKETMEYWPGKGYEIDNEQKLILSKDQDLKIKVSFLRN